MIRCFERLPLEQPQRRFGDPIEMLVVVLDVLAHVLKLAERVGEANPAGNLVHDPAHLLDLLKVEEEQASLVLVGQDDRVAVGLIEDLTQRPEDEAILEERPVAHGPGEPQRPGVTALGRDETGHGERVALADHGR